MNIGFLLEMAAEGMPDRIAVGSRRAGTTYAQLHRQAHAIADVVARTDVGGQSARNLVMVDVNSDLLPGLLFGAAAAGVPFVPLNYRLADDKLIEQVVRTSPAFLVADPVAIQRLGDAGAARIFGRDHLVDVLTEQIQEVAPRGVEGDEDSVAALLFTSGTTGAPKAAILRNRHLASYILSTTEFGSAGDDEATLVSVPPYHIAGISAILSAVYAGRRLVYLPAFDADLWVEQADVERITHAMVVPTMLGRILNSIEARGTNLPYLRHLSSGGGPMPLPVIERALALLPHVDFVNAYGLTETSSTISLLTPDDHRAAISSPDPAVKARLRSVGRPLPGVEIDLRDAEGMAVPVGTSGEVWVRGGQVAGEYQGKMGTSDADGWFPTRDSGYMDEHGYLYLSGRLDDVIVRGGENISPGEVESALLEHECVADVAVVGIADEAWGEKVVAYVVSSSTVSAEDLKTHVRTRLRSAYTPEEVYFVRSLPYSETGKLLRRTLRAGVAQERLVGASDQENS